MTAQMTNNESGTELVVSEPAAEVRVSVDSENSEMATWRKVVESATDIISDLPEYIGRFFHQNGSLISAIGWLIVALLGIRVLSALIGTINGIPLLSPLFELVGLGYSIWFVNRYLLTSGKRQELSQEVNRIKQQILG
ncbi:CAAD domain-containing protein [Microcoleus sp. FACHB-1515]|uniref:CAAD domain-containing protein n=1 Tax=Cyanophyceae TaxID=3028117 RepID=UPI001685CA68|nr:CAAD domain-containing protein [Microcoleus sp. FACHB-1515]MBD2092697.1 CAAD domain-containing protein [Microcoleus sp. FACHB-1515]